MYAPQTVVCHFLFEDLNLFAGAPEARRCFNIRNQSFLLVLDPLHHDVMATRQQGDELRVMDICVGTFPFPASLRSH